MMGRFQKKRGILAIAGALIVLALVSSEVYSASLTLTGQPLQNSATDGKVTHTTDWSSAATNITRHESSVVSLNSSNQVTGVTVGGTKVVHTGLLRVKVTVKDSVGATLDSGSGSAPTASGTYSTPITLTGGTVPYQKIATVATTYTQPVIVQLTSVADTYVREDAATTNFGTATTFIVQSRNASRNRRGLVQFNISSIPAGSTISSASLRLCATAVPGATRTYNVHQVTAGWTETVATWANQPTVAGSATASATTPASPSCMTWTVTADVVAWVAGTANNGWRISDSVESSATNYNTTFSSRENAIVADRPRLDVNYTPP